MAFLVVLDSMTPAERVAFVLHDVFRYPFAEVAEIVGRTPAACRQLASSARRRIRSRAAPAAPTSSGPASSGTSSGRGRPRTSRPWSACSTPTRRRSPTAAGSPRGTAPDRRRRAVAKYLAGSNARGAGATLLETTVNGRARPDGHGDGVTVMVMAFDIAGDRITRIWAVRNPEKLRPWTA